nr:MAG TPA: hypothetical protein [Caudoviricetes sp.]
MEYFGVHTDTYRYNSKSSDSKRVTGYIMENVR